MAHETPATELPQNTLPPDIDAELDAALSKSFAGKISETPKEEAPSKEVVDPVVNNGNQEPKPKAISDKQPENKPAEKVEKIEKPVDDKPPLTQEQIDKLNPTDKGAWGAIKAANKNANKMISQRDEEIAKLKATIAEKSTASQKELEAIRAEKAELEKYRAMVDIQADPEFISKYDEPIKKSVGSIKEMIKSLGVSQEVVDGINFENTAKVEEIVDIIISQNKNRVTASRIEAKVREYMDLKDKRDQTLVEHKNSFKETIEKKKQEAFAKEAEGDGRMIKHIESLSTQKDDAGNPVIPFLQKQALNEGASQAEIDRANNHNAMVDLMNQKLQMVLKMKEPEQRAEVAIAAVASHFLKAQLKTVQEELERVKAELATVATINSETPTRRPSSIPRTNGNEPVDHDTALNNFFSKRR